MSALVCAKCGDPIAPAFRGYTHLPKAGVKPGSRRHVVVPAGVPAR